MWAQQLTTVMATDSTTATLPGPEVGAINAEGPTPSGYLANGPRHYRQSWQRRLASGVRRVSISVSALADRYPAARRATGGSMRCSVKGQEKMTGGGILASWQAISTRGDLTFYHAI